MSVWRTLGASEGRRKKEAAIRRPATGNRRRASGQTAIVTLSAGTDTQAERQQQVEQNGLGPFGSREDEIAAASLFQRVGLLMTTKPPE